MLEGSDVALQILSTLLRKQCPSREVSLIYAKKELKLHIIDALRNTITGVVRGAIAFQNVAISSPLERKKI